MGVTQAAGLSLRWFRDQFACPTNGNSNSYEQLTAGAANVPPDPMACFGLLTLWASARLISTRMHAECWLA